MLHVDSYMNPIYYVTIKIRTNAQKTTYQHQKLLKNKTKKPQKNSNKRKRAKEKKKAKQNKITLNFKSIINLKNHHCNYTTNCNQ